VEEYIRNVADTTQEIYQGRGNIFYDIKADFRLSHKYMLDLGIAINELITNALKYGPKPNQGDFTIAVTLKDGGERESICWWSRTMAGALARSICLIPNPRAQASGPSS
jgi:two-component sensor histidine kinase